MTLGSTLAAGTPALDSALPGAHADATALAHDLRALLARVLGHTEQLDRTLADGGAGQASLEAIRTAATSALDVAERLRDAAHGGVAADVPGTTDVERLVRSVAADLARRFQERLSIVVHAAPRLWMAAADGALVQEAVAAVVSHAADVVPHGATVRLRMSNVETCARHASFMSSRRGRFVRVEIALPSGTAHLGLTAIARDAVLAPSTRVERGLGALRAAGCRVAVDGDGEAATIVALLLPSGSAATTPAADVAVAAPGRPSGAHTLGVVDADGARRALLCKILAAQGYRVLSAAATSELSRVRGQLDLLLTDRMDPADVSEPRPAAPDCPVIYIGRGAPDSRAHDAGPVTVIPQPFGAAALVTAVRHALRAAPFKNLSRGPIPCQEGA